MIATISQHSRIQDHLHSMLAISANAAGHALPLIPRRPQPHIVQSSAWPHSCSLKSSLPLSATPPLPCVGEGNRPNTSLPTSSIVTITPATPPKNDSETEESPQPSPHLRKSITDPSSLHPLHFSPRISPNKRDDETLTTKDSPASSSWTAQVYTPGMPLRFSIESLRNAANKNSSGQLPFPSSSASAALSPSSSLTSVSSQSSQTSQPSTPVIRKKSGQIVRPSLKSSPSYSASSNLGIVSPTPSLISSKSEPVTPFRATTPTSTKAVHFDTNLAQIKLFLTQQKPLAVSRDGSDTDDGESTSGLENVEVKRFFGSGSSMGDFIKKSATKLVMNTNLPPHFLSVPPSGVNVALQSLQLAKGDKSILGSVMVRNLAFDKTVTARFTFDGWCTTSEVSAKWREGLGSMRQGETEWDRFEFTICIGDLNLFEEKGGSRRLELAIKYLVASKGLESWDNNGFRNYMATFEQSRLPEELKERGRKTRLRKKIPSALFSDDELSDLLEKVAKSRRSPRKSRSTSPTSTAADSKQQQQQSNWLSMPLYASPASTPNSILPPPHLHTRARSFPFSGSPTMSPDMKRLPPPSPPTVPAWLIQTKSNDLNSPERISSSDNMNLGSPRDSGDGEFLFIKPHANVSDNLKGHTVTHATTKKGDSSDSKPEQCTTKKAARRRRHRVLAEQQLMTPSPSPSSTLTSFPPLDLGLLRESRGEGRAQSLEEFERRSSNSPMDDSPLCVVSEATSFFQSQSQSEVTTIKTTTTTSSGSTTAATSSSLSPFAVWQDYYTSDSSSSSLLENESPDSSRSSTPPFEDQPGMIQQHDDSTKDDRELYREFLDRFCFFTGPGTPPSQSNNRLPEDVNITLKNNMTDTGSESESTPTITPSVSHSES